MPHRKSVAAVSEIEKMNHYSKGIPIDQPLKNKIH
jgi:hypothetical protein